MNHQAYYIILEDDVLLSKKEYGHWREIQDEYYEKFKASLAPMSCDELIAYFAEDYGQDDSSWPFTRKDIFTFFEGEQITLYSTRSTRS